MSVDRKRTKAEQRHLAQMIEGLEDLSIDMELLKRTHELVPRGWAGAHLDAPCGPAKKKMTIRLEAEVLDWYRSLGGGYQRRINVVLKTYMHAVLAKHIEQPGDRDWRGNPI